jgi:glycosidase
MFLGLVFSVVTAMAGLYYSYSHSNPEFIAIVEKPPEPLNVKAEDEIVYKLFLPSFQDSDGDGIGDVGGLSERQSYLEHLGIKSVVILNMTDEFKFSRTVKSPERARLDAMFLLTRKESPVIHYGEEIGMTQESGWWTKPDSRVPMQWDSGPIAGFSTVQPWLDFSERIASVKEQWEDYDSLLWLYKKLIGLRSWSDALRLGDQIFYPHDHSDLILYSRNYQDKTMWVALNMGKEHIRLEHAKPPEVHVSTYSKKSDGFELRPFEGIIWSY